MHVIDSHTGGEPTRVILDGGPELGSGPLRARADILASRHAGFYRSVMLEPRGQTAMVGALLVSPTDPTCETGVIYFDAGAVLGMCGHGTIGLGVTLAHLGRIDTGTHRIETPVGVVEILLLDANTIRVTNVESYRHLARLSVSFGGIGQVTGDVAYGGNWFFIVEDSPVAVRPDNLRQLTDAAIALRQELARQGITGANDAPVDHIIFQAPSAHKSVLCRNFVLCPDDAYDRSPCGTGSSARLACLAADGRLAPGQEIIQESVIGSRYRLSYRSGKKGGVIPMITGQAFLTAEARLIFDDADPFKSGILL
jgi:proline racemase/4-hydroxyproline epimerase